MRKRAWLAKDKRVTIFIRVPCSTFEKSKDKKCGFFKTSSKICVATEKHPGAFPCEMAQKREAE